MADSIVEQKSALRTAARAALRVLSGAERGAASATICARLQAQPIWQSAGAVLLFAPLADEPDIWPVLSAARAAGKTVALPRFIAARNAYEAALITDAEQDVLVGHLSIREPAAHCPTFDLKRLDLILVPGLAFDWHGRRLGRGKGFYDRLLAEVSGSTCGVAFDQQMVAAIPVGPHDVSLNCILTPARWLAL